MPFYLLQMLGLDLETFGDVLTGAQPLQSHTAETVPPRYSTNCKAFINAAWS